MNKQAAAFDGMKVGDTFTIGGYRKDRRFKCGVRRTGNPADIIEYRVTNVVTGAPTLPPPPIDDR